ncbi:hypothetical protein F2Q68_00027278 [Brassica cretica]|uniref:Uncharacterized protein n=1 Tax=Brassica cretica TaxID=69181 RepID=A0A8S9IC79_BRACR|nr:hypothetical protein F2Q68_00027278 [Brassica cretica]
MMHRGRRLSLSHEPSQATTNSVFSLSLLSPGSSFTAAKPNRDEGSSMALMSPSPPLAPPRDLSSQSPTLLSCLTKLASPWSRSCFSVVGSRRFSLFVTEEEASNNNGGLWIYCTSGPSVYWIITT